MAVFPTPFASFVNHAAEDEEEAATALEGRVTVLSAGPAATSLPNSVLIGSLSNQPFSIEFWWTDSKCGVNIDGDAVPEP